VFYEQAGMSGCNNTGSSPSNPNPQPGNTGNPNSSADSPGDGQGINTSNQGSDSNPMSQAINSVKNFFGEDFNPKAGAPTSCQASFFTILYI